MQLKRLLSSALRIPHSALERSALRTPHSALGRLLSAICYLLSPLLCASALAQSAAWVTTDASDYPPGSTVYITGAGFAPGETVTCQVLHSPTGSDDLTSPAHQPWTVTADADGNF